jgi:hypothetical protein
VRDRREEYAMGTYRILRPPFWGNLIYL